MAVQQQATLVLVGVGAVPSIHDLNNFNEWLRGVAPVPPDVLNVWPMLPATRRPNPWSIQIQTRVQSEKAASQKNQR